MSPHNDPTFSDPQAVVGEGDDEQHRAAPGEGVRAPSVSEGADHPEMSIFDGAGNESVVAITTDDKGRVSEGTGETSEEALTDAQDHRLGAAFHTGPDTGGT